MMKNKKILLVLLGAAFLNYNKNYGSLDYSTPTIISVKQPAGEQTRSLSASAPIDSISTTKVDFAKTQFNQNQSLFYLGAKNAATDDKLKTFAVSRVSLRSSILSIIDIAPATLAGTDPKTNPLYGTQILNMVVFGQSYLAVNAPTGETPTDNKVYLILNPDSSGNTVWESESIKDAKQEEATKEIKSLASSNDYIFAAVSAKDFAWDDNSAGSENRGIAVIYPDSAAKGLKVLDANNIDNGTEENKAAKLNVAASQDSSKVEVAFRKTGSGITKAEFQPEGQNKATVDMFWSNDLQRLFIAMTDVTRDDPTKEGGVVSVVVGRLEKDSSTGKTALLFSPIIANPASKFTTEETTHILGFYYSTTTHASKVSTKKVKIMHTSTDKYYLITNSNFIINVQSPGIVNGYDGVFAFPLITSNDDPKLIGTINVMPSITDQKFTVGTNNIEATIEDSEATTDIFVHGDSVYLCLGSNSNPQSLGIFQSTAIFDANGNILSWTPWQRVIGSIQKVWGGAVDANSNNFYFLASQTPLITDQTSNVVRVTQWGKTEDVNLSTDHNLSTVLADIFPQSEGGILQIFDFNTQTDGFHKNIFSMMVVIGHSKIALVQTGEWYSGVLQPISKFEVGKNIIVYNDDALKNIAPLCYAEVSRTIADDSGYLFIGGLGGVAVLNSGNKGWPSQTGLSSVSDLSKYSFKQLTANSGDFKNVRKLACCNNKLWFATKDNFYKVNISSNSFIKDNTNETLINPNLPAGTKYSDFIVVPGSANAEYLVLGTTGGLYSFKVGENTAYKVGSVNNPAVHLNYISMDKANTSAQGNLYVLYSNFLDEVGKVYRYHVDGDGKTAQALLQPIKPTNTSDGLFVDLHYYRGNFVSDGSFGFSLLSKGPGQQDLFHIYEITTKSSEQNHNLTRDIGIKPEKDWYIGAVTKNSTSGSIMVPGDWGLIVNE